MRREQRLRRAADFSAVYNRGRAWSAPMMVVKVTPNRLPVTRFGFAVGKKLGGAVVRNRVKRRLREIVRSLDAGSGWDVILIARAPAVNAGFADLQNETRELFRRARLGTDAPVPARPARAAVPS
jgi:ribonuclease P protein component